MKSTDATTPKQYIDGLPEERRPTMRKLRALLRKHLPKGFVESIRWGMICYEVPLKTFPETYNGQPLMYAALAAQKNHYGVYLCGIYSDETLKAKFVKQWKDRGTKLDMGKSCIRLKDWDACEDDLIGEAIAAFSVDEFVELTQEINRRTKKKK
ncbi:MAG: DUF1801 domain-containing protein [Planctomycetota bacterium]